MVNDMHVGLPVKFASSFAKAWKLMLPVHFSWKLQISVSHLVWLKTLTVISGVMCSVVNSCLGL